MGADILYGFPYGRAFESESFLWPNVESYSVWICLDLFIIWVFSFVSFRMQDVEPGEPNSRLKPRWAAMSQGTYAIVLYVTMVCFLGASVAYDVVSYYQPSIFLIV